MAKKLKVRYYKQKKDFTCGPACLQMVFNFFGKKLKQRYISKLANTNHKTGTRNRGMISVARKEGFYCYAHENGKLNQIKYFIDHGLPVIIEYIEPSNNDIHFSVVTGYSNGNIIMNDPWNGKDFIFDSRKFSRRWHATNKNYTFTCWFMVISDKKLDLGRKYPTLNNRTNF